MPEVSAPHATRVCPSCEAVDSAHLSAVRAPGIASLEGAASLLGLSAHVTKESGG